MPFEILDTLSLPGDPLKPNDDAFAHLDKAAVVLDGATSLGDPLMPGESDAAWLAHFGARRLMAHVGDGETPLTALRYALADAKKSFEALRRRAPEEVWEMPFASMALAVESASGFDFLWFGDCAGLLRHADGRLDVLGHSFVSKAREAKGAATAASALKRAPVSEGSLSPYLPLLRRERNRMNSGKRWAFSPDPKAAEHVNAAHVQAEKGAHLMLASDGFLALVSDYGAYRPEALFAAALKKGLAPLGEELRLIEDNDPEGREFPRFKKSDDATAVLLQLV
jgi:protein phosphatase 2C-like protein